MFVWNVGACLHTFLSTHQNEDRQIKQLDSPFQKKRTTIGLGIETMKENAAVGRQGRREKQPVGTGCDVRASGCYDGWFWLRTGLSRQVAEQSKKPMERRIGARAKTHVRQACGMFCLLP